MTYYELRSGHHPFPPQKEFKYPADNPDLTKVEEPERVVLAKAMNRRWLDRWPNCTAMMNALRDAVTAPKNTPPTPRSKASSANVIKV